MPCILLRSALVSTNMGSCWSRVCGHLLPVVMWPLLVRESHVVESQQCAQWGDTSGISNAKYILHASLDSSGCTLSTSHQHTMVTRGIEMGNHRVIYPLKWEQSLRSTSVDGILELETKVTPIKHLHMFVADCNYVTAQRGPTQSHLSLLVSLQAGNQRDLPITIWPRPHPSILLRSWSWVAWMMKMLLQSNQLLKPHTLRIVQTIYVTKIWLQHASWFAKLIIDFQLTLVVSNGDESDNDKIVTASSHIKPVFSRARWSTSFLPTLYACLGSCNHADY